MIHAIEQKLQDAEMRIRSHGLKLTARQCARLMVFLIVTAINTASCKREAPPSPIAVKEYIQPDTPPVYAAPTGATETSLRFTDITASADLHFIHENGAFGEKWMPETMGGGGGFFDYDGDGWADVLLVNSGYWPGHEKPGPPPTGRLYRNQRNGTFEDVTEASGLLNLFGYGMGFAAADYDGDGDADVYITAVGKNHLLRNDDGKFVDVTDDAGVGFSTCNGTASPWEWSTGAAWLDHDRDGDLDLFVCNYVSWTPQTDIWSTLDGKTKSYATPQPYEGATSVLFRNEGDGTFSDVTKQAGVFNREGKSMSVVADDFNNDGWPDLVITNDTQPNFLYINNQNGTFTDRALSAGVAYDENGLARAGMGVSVADLDNRGGRSIAIGNFSGEPVSLYTQTGMEAFLDRAGATRLSKPTTTALTFGLLFADFNLDGFEDLLLANGHIEPEIEHVRETWQFAQRPQLFLNNRTGQFVEISDSAGAPFESRIVGRSVATADIDGDGDLDVLLTTNAGPAKLLRNDGPKEANVVRVRLIGSGGNTNAVGATVRAEIAGKTQTRYITTGGSYLSQSELVAMFGLGQATAITRLTVRWPDGSPAEFPNIAAGSLHTIQQGAGVIRTEPLRPRP